MANATNEAATTAEAKGNGKGKTKQSKAQAQKAVALLDRFQPKQLATDIGPKVLASLDGATKDDVKIETLKAASTRKKHEAHAALTMAIVNMAKADNRIKLDVAFGDDLAAKNLLNDALRIGLGISEIYEDEKGNKRIRVTKAAARYMPTEKDGNKDSVEYKRKVALRNNLATFLKRSAQEAAGIMDMGANAAIDDKSGTLKLSGPKVKETFGEDNVVLDDSQPEGATVKRSFTTLRDKAAQARNVAPATTSKAGTEHPPKEATSVEAFGTLCNNLINAVNRIQPLSDDHKRHLKAVQALLNKVL